MPEALAVMLVFFICVLIYVIAKIQDANAPRNPRAELIQLQQHQAWLLERLQSAEQGNWDDTMKAQLAEQLAETQRKLRETAALAA